MKNVPPRQAALSAAGKVLAVLGVFAPDTRQLTLSEIARRTGLTLSTTHRIVTELASWGALERGEDGRYCVGLRLYEVGVLAPRGTALRDAAMPFMEDLYEITAKTIVDPGELRTILGDVRRTGIATSDRQVTMDSFSVGAPVRDPSGAVVAAVSVVVHAGSYDTAVLAAVVGAAARGISRSLAGPSALQRATSRIPSK